MVDWSYKKLGLDFIVLGCGMIVVVLYGSIFGMGDMEMGFFLGAWFFIAPKLSDIICGRTL